jgi:hypothetical protein
MNNTAAHLVTNVASWVEHEEICVLTFMKKSSRWIECEIETIVTIGIIGTCTVGVLVRLSQISQYFQILSCCN